MEQGNRKKRKMSFTTVGGSSILTIFAVLMFVVFALLSLSTAKANAGLTDKSTESVTNYYRADTEAEEILRTSNAQIERTIKEIRNEQAEKERTKELRRQLDEFKQRLSAEEPDDPGRLKELTPKDKPRRKQPKKAAKPVALKERPLQAGDNVVIKGTTTVGTLIAIDEKYVLVAFGNIKTRIEADKVERTMRKEKKPKAESLGRSTTDEIRTRQLNFKPDIDVRGMRADEAIQAITYFIDDAIQFSAQRVRILHGTGTGALKVAIREYLRTVSGIKSFRDEHVQFGGAGITVVELE